MAEPQEKRNLGSWNAMWKVYWTPTLDGGTHEKWICIKLVSVFSAFICRDPSSLCFNYCKVILTYECWPNFSKLKSKMSWLLVLQLSLIIWKILDPITSDLFREEEKEYTHKRGEDKEQMEAETVVIGPQTEKCHQPPEIGSKWWILSLEPLDGMWPCQHLTHPDLNPMKLMLNF